MIDSFSGIYRFLSNFYPCRIEFEERRYESVEAAYQAMKTLDVNARQMFERLPAPDAKKMGRLLKMRSDWEDVKLEIMEQLVEIKFQEPMLRSALIDTGNEEIVEGNYWKDTFWGVCNGVGENHLGKILMQVRQKIRGARS